MEQLKLEARTELHKLDFPDSLWLELYWICCVESDYSFDYETTFENIAVPNWLPLPFDSQVSLKIAPGIRMYPPAIYHEGDMDFLASHFGSWILIDDIIGRPDVLGWFGIFLSSIHELLALLKKSKGRPKKSGKIGRRPEYSDRLAVQCAALKDEPEMTYVKIAKTLGLPTERNKETTQEESRTARHLVRRGRKLISECTDLI